MSMTTSIATKSCAHYLVFRGFFLFILGEEGFEDVSESAVDTDVGLPVVKVDVDLRVAQGTAASVTGDLGTGRDRKYETGHVENAKLLTMRVLTSIGGTLAMRSMAHWLLTCFSRPVTEYEVLYSQIKHQLFSNVSKLCFMRSVGVTRSSVTCEPGVPGVVLVPLLAGVGDLVRQGGAGRHRPPGHQPGQAAQQLPRHGHCGSGYLKYGEIIGNFVKTC